MVACALDGGARRLVGVEPDVHSSREVVVVDGHTLEVVGVIDSDSNLGVACIAQAEVFDTTTDLDQTISVFTALVAVDDLEALGVDTLELGSCAVLLERVALVIGI